MASRSLGTLTIDLIAKTGAFVSGLSKAERETAKNSKAMQRQMDDLRKTAMRAGAVLGTAFAGAAALIIKNTIDASREQAQLAAVLKSTGAVAGQSQEQLNAMADALQQVSTFAAGNITEMQSVLLTFTKIQGDVFPKAQQAVLDMATALGMDLQGAAIQLGKALNDPIKGVSALGRAGVQFSEDQKAMIKSLVETGRIAEAQTLILKELETQFGGSARAASGTLGGALTILKNNFNDLLEGDTGGDGVRGAIGAIQELSATLSSPEVKQGFASIIEGAAVATAKLAELISTAAGLSRFLGEEFAARVGGANAQDTVRVEERIQRLKDTIKAVQDAGVFNPTAILDASELIPSDLLSRTQTVLDRLQGELDKEQNKLQLGLELNTQAAFGVQGDAAPASTSSQGASDTRQAISPEIQKVVDKLREEAEAYGLSRAALLEREKAQKLAVASNDLEREAIEASYSALIAKVSAEERATTSSKSAAAAMRDIKAQEKREAEAALKLAEQLYEQRKELRDLAAEEARQKEEALAPGRELVANLKFELELMKMTNAERALAIQLRGLDSEAVAKYGAEIEQLNADIEANIKVAEGMDVVRDATRGLFSDLMDGSKSAKDAFKDFVGSVLDGISQIVARNLTEQLLGSFGSTGGGASGNGLASLFASFFGGARASGGPVYPGKAYLVGEEGPELIRPMGAAMVSSARDTQRQISSGVTTNIQFVLPGRNDLRTEAQRQADLARSTQRQMSRGTA